MNKFLCVKNVYDCNLKCWYCSTHGTGYIPEKDLIELYRRHNPSDMLLIGGEPMILSPDYYLNLLESGLRFSMQSNLTLYTKEWDEVLTHKNFTGISVSGDKFSSDQEFFDKYNDLRDLMTDPPMVLIVLDGDYQESLEKAKRWTTYAFACDFPLRINYLAPMGRALENKNRLLKISKAYDIYTALIDSWVNSGFKILQPHTYILEFLTKHNQSICPFISNCISSHSIVDVEVDLSEYSCPALGDLRLGKRDILVDISDKCLYCDFYEVCRGCYIRNWEVDIEKDADYCHSAKKFFKRLTDLIPAYEKRVFDYIS